MATNLIDEAVYENLPEFLKEITDQFEGRERDIVLMSSLGVLSAALPNVWGTYDKTDYSPHLYLLVIAPPASGKSVMKFSLKLINKVHDRVLNTSKTAKEECEEETSSEEKEKRKKSKCPELEILVAPANVSSARLYTHLYNSKYGLLIFETEADTLSNMLKQDWGNMSDVLRKAFHHEKISISRETEDKFIEIYNPKLSLVLSGTPDQVKPLVQSKDNGLFSRFLFYSFDEISKWKDVSPMANSRDLGSLLEKKSQQVLRLFDILTNTQTSSLYGFVSDDPVVRAASEKTEITLSQSQWERLNLTMEEKQNSLEQHNLTELIPGLRRHSTMVFRIAMILTVLRNYEMRERPQVLECSEIDYELSLNIILTTIDHCVEILNNLSKKQNYNFKQIELLDKLPENFTRSQAITIGQELKIPQRTTDSWLKKFVEKKSLKKLGSGEYSKTTTN